MILLSNNQISELLSYIRFNYTMYIGKHVGADVLTNDDISVLNKFGIDIDDFPEYTTSDMAFEFGRLSQALSREEVASMPYQDIKKFIQGGGYFPMTDVEKSAFEYSKSQSYNSIKRLGEKAGSDLHRIVGNSEQAIRSKYEEIIRSETQKTIVLRRSMKDMALAIQHQTGDWTRDMDRVVETEMHNTFDNGRASYLQGKYGGDVLVYKDVYDNACKHCIRLYTTNGIGSKPRVFKLSTLISNGTNVGRKADDWKPVIGATHPYCRCTLNKVPDEYNWDSDSRSFTKPDKKFNRKSNVLRGNIKIKVGDKEFLV